MSSAKPQSPPLASPRTGSTNKDLERQLKEAKARKKEAEKEFARSKEQLAKTKGALKATEGDVEQLEKDLAVQERALRERDRSLQYITELLSSSHGRVGGNEILASVFGKLARFGTIKKKKKGSNKKKEKGDDKRGEGQDEEEHEEEEGEEEKEREAKEKRSHGHEDAGKHKEEEEHKEKKKNKKNEEEEEEDRTRHDDDHYDDGYDEDDEDDDGFFIFDMRSKVPCEKGPRGVCVWEEFNHFSSSLRYFRDLRVDEAASLFAAGEQPAAVLEALRAKTRAPLPLLQGLLRRVEKAVGKHRASACLLIGLIAVSQAADYAEKESRLYDAIVTGRSEAGEAADGRQRLTLEGARELFRYRLLFVQAVVRASPPAGLDEKEVKKGLKKLFGKRAREREADVGCDNGDGDGGDHPKAWWDRAAASVFRFVRKQREREQRTRIDSDDEEEEEAEEATVTRREWVKAMQYFAHYFHSPPSRQLCRGDADEAGGEENGDDASASKEKERKQQQKHGARESGESGVGDCDTDNEEHYFSDYEVDDDVCDDSKERRKRTKRADWEVEHAHDLAAVIGGLNDFLRPAASSCRAVVTPPTLLLPSPSVL